MDNKVFWFGEYLNSSCLKNKVLCKYKVQVKFSKRSSLISRDCVCDYSRGQLGISEKQKT